MASFAFGDTFYVFKCLLKFGECGMRLNAFVTVRISFSLERQGLIGIWLSAKELGGSCPSHYKSSHPTDRRHLHHLKKILFVRQIKNHLFLELYAIDDNSSNNKNKLLTKIYLLPKSGKMVEIPPSSAANVPQKPGRGVDSWE